MATSWRRTADLGACRIPPSQRPKRSWFPAANASETRRRWSGPRRERRPTRSRSCCPAKCRAAVSRTCAAVEKPGHYVSPWSALGGELAILASAYLFYAIVINNRRLAWIELALSLLVMVFLLPPAKRRRLLTWLPVVVPAILVYVAVGWGSQEAVFAPLKASGLLEAKLDYWARGTGARARL